jgi:putative phosphoesterase
MRIAAIYDIHGNLPALEAVIDDIRAEKVDLIIVGGDALAGPMPLETLMLLRDISIEIPTQFIHGNAESELLRYLRGEDVNGLSDRANEEVQWVAKKLGADQAQFLANWPLTVQVETDEWGEVLFCHATPRNDIDVFTRFTPEAKILPIFKNLTASVVVCGHTHMQFDRTIGGVRVVNAGSVGMPFGLTQTRANWLLVGQEIVFRRSEYNLNRAADRIRQSDYPEAEDFALNNVLNTPSEALAMEMLTRLEAEQSEK